MLWIQLDRTREGFSSLQVISDFHQSEPRVEMRSHIFGVGRQCPLVVFKSMRILGKPIVAQPYIVVQFRTRHSRCDRGRKGLYGPVIISGRIQRQAQFSRRILVGPPKLQTL